MQLNQIVLSHDDVLGICATQIKWSRAVSERVERVSNKVGSDYVGHGVSRPLI